jgi:hypothetical protein
MSSEKALASSMCVSLELPWRLCDRRLRACYLI